MLAFFDGAAVTAMSLFIGLVLGIYAETHPDWRIFASEASAVAISVVLATTAIIGTAAAILACTEQGHRLLPWMVLFAAIQAATVAIYRVVRRMILRTPLPAT